MFPHRVLPFIGALAIIASGCGGGEAGDGAAKERQTLDIAALSSAFTRDFTRVNEEARAEGDRLRREADEQAGIVPDPAAINSTTTVTDADCQPYVPIYHCEIATSGPRGLTFLYDVYPEGDRCYYAEVRTMSIPSEDFYREYDRGEGLKQKGCL